MTTIIAPSDTVSLQAQQSALSITGWGETISEKGFLAREKALKVFFFRLLSNFHPGTFCFKVAWCIFHPNSLYSWNNLLPRTLCSLEYLGVKMDFYLCICYNFSHTKFRKQIKGQLISNCPFGVIVWTKIPTKNFPGFLP